MIYPGNAKIYPVDNEDLVELFQLVQTWAAEKNIDNLAVAAQAMRHVAGILEKTAAESGHFSHRIKVAPE